MTDLTCHRAARYDPNPNSGKANSIDDSLYKTLSAETAAGRVALAAGPVAGGFLVGFVGWRSIFLVNLPIGQVGIGMTTLFIDEIGSTERCGSFHVGPRRLPALRWWD